METGTADGQQQIREFTPLLHLLSRIPLKAQKGLTTLPLNFTCVAAAGEFLALGTNVGLIYWFNRTSLRLDRLKTEVAVPIMLGQCPSQTMIIFIQASLLLEHEQSDIQHQPTIKARHSRGGRKCRRGAQCLSNTSRGSRESLSLLL